MVDAAQDERVFVKAHSFFFGCMFYTEGKGHNKGTVAAVVTHSDINVDVGVDVGRQHSWQDAVRIAIAWCTGACTCLAAVAWLQGMTALHLAAFGQRTDTAELLLAHGADANVRGADGATPLYLACMSHGWRLSPSVQLFLSDTNQEGPESSDMVRLLLSHGADVNFVSAQVRGCLVVT